MISRHGRLVRVKPEIEEIVRLLANELAYEEHTIRNTALIYGLIILGLTKAVPTSDDEFRRLLNIMRNILVQAQPQVQTQIPLFR